MDTRTQRKSASADTATLAIDDGESWQDALKRRPSLFATNGTFAVKGEVPEGHGGCFVMNDGAVQLLG